MLSYGFAHGRKYGQALPPKSVMDTPISSSKRSAESTISNVQIF